MKEKPIIFRSLRSKRLVELIKHGGVGVLPTDTLYGVVCSALNREAVDYLYAVRKRAPEKPCIILIGSFSDMRRLSLSVAPPIRKILSGLMPGPVSVILSCTSKKLQYVHRGTYTLAVRIPKERTLVHFLEKTGPLLAPTANKEGEPPARTIVEARRSFGDSVDFYVDGATRNARPSRILALRRGRIRIVRE